MAQCKEQSGGKSVFLQKETEQLLLEIDISLVGWKYYTAAGSDKYEEMTHAF